MFTPSGSEKYFGKYFQLIWAWKGQRSPHLGHLHIMDEVPGAKIFWPSATYFFVKGWDESSLPRGWGTKVGSCIFKLLRALKAESVRWRWKAHHMCNAHCACPSINGFLFRARWKSEKERWEDLQRAYTCVAFIPQNSWRREMLI